MSAPTPASPVAASHPPSLADKPTADTFNSTLERHFQAVLQEDFTPTSITALIKHIQHGLQPHSVSLDDRVSNISALHHVFVPKHHSCINNSLMSPIHAATVNDLTASIDNLGKSSGDHFNFDAQQLQQRKERRNSQHTHDTASTTASEADTSGSDAFDECEDDGCDQADVLDAIGFDIVELLLPYTIIPGSLHMKEEHTAAVRAQTHDLVSAICKQCRPREVYLVLLSFLETHQDLTVAYSLFPYIERCIQRVTNHKRADLLESLFPIIMAIWRASNTHEDEVSVKFVTQLADSLDSLTWSLARLQDDVAAYEREQGILLTVVLRAAQWLLAEHWDSLVQDGQPRKLKRYQSREKNEALQRKYSAMLVERVPNIIRCVVHCGRVTVILSALEQTLPVPISILPPPLMQQGSVMLDGHSSSGPRPMERPGSVQYSSWSLPGIASLIALLLALAKFQDNMGHDNCGVRSNILVAIDQARNEFPDVNDIIPANRALLMLQCYPLLNVLLADTHRHPAYLPLCVHLWRLLQNEIQNGSLDDSWLQPNPSAHGRSLWLFYELAISAIVQVSDDCIRQEFVKVFQQLIDLFDPHAKFQLLKRGLLSCPYSNINSLLLTTMKNQTHQASIRRSGSQHNLNIQLQMQVYSSPEVAEVIQHVVLACKDHVIDRLDTLVAALNYVKYILLRQQAISSPTTGHSYTSNHSTPPQTPQVPMRIPAHPAVSRQNSHSALNMSASTSPFASTSPSASTFAQFAGRPRLSRASSFSTPQPISVITSPRQYFADTFSYLPNEIIQTHKLVQKLKRQDDEEDDLVLDPQTIYHQQVDVQLQLVQSLYDEVHELSCM